MQIITEKDNQLVAQLFNAVFAELNRIADDIKMAMANAAMDGDFEKMDAAKGSALQLKDFAEEVTALSSCWENGIFNAPVPEKMPQTASFNGLGNRTKKSPTRLRVVFTNINKEIQSRTAAQTFVESLRMLKFEHVATLNKQVAGYPLVSKTEFSSDPNRYLKCGDWYVNFPSSTQYKKSFLEEISAVLNIPLRVDVV
jgi:hypothetical protein